MAVEILKTYLCRGESRNNGSDGDESPGRGRQTCLGRQGAISFLPSACFVRHLLLPHPPNALYNDNPDLAYLRPLLCIIPNLNVPVHSTYISPPMLMHPERAQGIFVHPGAALARGPHVVDAEANCEVGDGGADFHFTLDHLSPVGDVDGVRAC